MNIEQAERLSANDDFKAFLALLRTDADGMTEDLIYGKEPDELLRTQCKIIVLRGVTLRLQHLLADLKPEPPASSQPDE